MNRYLLPIILGVLALFAVFGSGIASLLGGLTDGAAGVTAQQANNAGADGAIQDPVGQAGRLVQRQSSPVAAAGQTVPGDGTGVGAAPNDVSGQQQQQQQQVPQQPQQQQPPVGAPPPANLEAIPALW
jgi:hypothetical protein